MDLIIREPPPSASYEQHMEFLTLLGIAVNLYASPRKRPSVITEQVYLRALEGYMEKWNVDSG